MKNFKKYISAVICFIFLCTGSLPGINLPWLGSVKAHAAPGGQILKLSVKNDGTTPIKRIGVNFSNAGAGSYTFAAGDYIEYDVKLDGLVAWAGSVDIKCTDGSLFKDAGGWGDQNGLNGGRGSDLTKYAANTWFHRKLKVPASMVGKTISKWSFINNHNLHNFAYALYFDNVQVTNGSGTVKLSAYGDGSPSENSIESQEGIAESKLVALDYSYVTGSPSGSILKFSVTNSSSTGDNKYTYWKFSNAGSGSYVFSAGDYIEYDVKLNGAFDVSSGSIDIKCSDGSYFRDAAGWADQKGISGHPASDLTSYADGYWYHRKLQVPSGMIGKTLSGWDLVGENNTSGKAYTACYDNIKVTNGSGTVRLTAYGDGNPSMNALDFNSGVSSTALTVQDYVSNMAAPSGEALKLLVRNTDDVGYYSATTDIDYNQGTSKYIYNTISNTSYTLTSGDTLEYDVKVEPVRGTFAPFRGGVGIDLSCTDGTAVRDVAGWKDQNDISGHPASDTSRYSAGNWYHRKLAIPAAMVGKSVNNWMAVCEYDTSSGMTISYFDNIKITNGATTRMTVYDNGNPVKNEVAFSSGVDFAVLTAVSVGGYPLPSPAVASTTLPTEDVPVVSFNVMNFGAVRDGITDDTRAFQQALYASEAAGGGVVFAPAGSYAIKGHLFIPTGVTLRGEWKNPDNGGMGQGTILKAYESRNNENGFSFIALDMSSAVTNLTIWYPEQNYNSIVPYPWTIQSITGDNATVRNITLINPYKAILLGLNWNEMAYVNNVYGSPLRKGIEVCFNTDVSRFENVNFTPTYWSTCGLAGAPSGAALQTLKNYMVANGEGMIFGRVDWGYLYNITLKSYAVGLKMVHTISKFNGAPFSGDATAVKLNIDECNVGILADEVNIQGLSVSDSTVKVSAGTNPVAVKTTSNFTTSLSFNKCTIGGAPKTAVSLLGSGNVSFQNCTFNDWGYQGGTYAIDAQAGSIAVNGCTFQKNTLSINIPSTIIAATVMGNTFNGSPQINNSSGKAIPYVWIDHTNFSFEQMSTTGHIYRSSIPKPANNNLYNVRNSPFNAAGDGTTDDTAAIQNALNAAGSAGGGTVYVPAGRYRVNGTLSVPAGVELRGVYDTPHHTSGEGSVLFAYYGKGNSNGTPFITLSQNAGVRGMTVYYPEQDHLNIQAYPWTIRGNGSSVYVISTTLANSYNGIDFGLTNPCDNHYIDSVLGCFLSKGIYAGKSATEGWVQNVHMNPHLWLRASYVGVPTKGWFDTLYPYMKSNVIGFTFGHCGNEHIFGNFGFASFYGMHFLAQAEGRCNANAILSGLDSTKMGIFIEAAASQGLNFTGTQFTVVPDTVEGRGFITVTGTNTAPVKFFNSRGAGGGAQNGANLGGGAAVIQQFLYTEPCSTRNVSITGGTADINSLNVLSNSDDVYAGSGITSARIVGSVCAGGFDVDNQAGAKATWFGNVTRDYSDISLTLSKPLTRAVMQRSSNNTASVNITGNYNGSGLSSIEARAVVMPGGTGTDSPWQTIVTNPVSGSFQGNITVAAGGWYCIQVRGKNGSQVMVETSVEKIGVGEVFITAGQSNSCNYGDTRLTPNDDRVSAWNPPAGSWQFAVDPQPGVWGNAGGDSGSPWPALGESLVQLLGVPIGFITCGEGSTSVQNWLPTGTLYPRIRSALELVGPNGARAILWHQGENDGSLGTSTADYASRLTTIINQSRTDAGWTVPWGVAVAAYGPNTPSAQITAVNNGQRQVMGTVPAVFQGAYTDDMLAPYRETVNYIHFNEAGLREHAKRWKDNIMQTFFQ